MKISYHNIAHLSMIYSNKERQYNKLYRIFVQKNSGVLCG